MIRLIRKLVVAAGTAVLIVIIGAGVVNYHVDSESKPYMVESDEAPAAEVILVLGASVLGNGGVSDILKDRLDTALSLYQHKRAPKILVSGDHGSPDYDEVGTMRKYLTDRKVAGGNILLDHSGFSTYESVYRAQAVFGVRKLIIVTQDYHLARAVYVARSLGMEAYGVAADQRQYHDMDKYRFREFLARNKDFVYARILKPAAANQEEKTFMTGAGRATSQP
ncbi:MAG: putative rane protein [Paenibacillaceae bacterium]|jgi:vancomycin permeability regulator SanA|nr:putative rane protein [Paenibacillaceae bacterium]